MPRDSSAAQENIDHLLLGRKEGEETLPNFTAAIKNATTPSEIMEALNGISGIAASVVESLEEIAPHEVAAAETLTTPARQRENENKKKGNQDLQDCQEFMASIPDLISRTQNGTVTTFESLQTAALALAAVVNKAGEAVGSAIGGHEAPSDVGQTHIAVARFTEEAKTPAAAVESYNESHPPLGVVMSDLETGERTLPKILKDFLKECGVDEKNPEDMRDLLENNPMLAAACLDPKVAGQVVEYCKDAGSREENLERNLADSGLGLEAAQQNPYLKALHGLEGMDSKEFQKKSQKAKGERAAILETEIKEAEEPNIFTAIFRAIAAVINSVAKLITAVASAISPPDPALEMFEKALDKKTPSKKGPTTPSVEAEAATVRTEDMAAAIAAASKVLESLQANQKEGTTTDQAQTGVEVAPSRQAGGGGRE